MGTLAWLVLVLAGVALGVAAGRFWPLDSLRLKTVEHERDAATKELQSYREEVSEHFQHTGELFDRITRDYHTLYEHLATGADRLCSPAHARNLLQAEPERRKLAHEAAPGESAPAAAGAPSPQSAAPVAPAMAGDASVNGKADSSKADTGPRPRDNVAAIRPELRAVESAADTGQQQAPRKNAPPAA
jgi:uncharacterized protein